MLKLDDARTNRLVLHKVALEAQESYDELSKEWWQIQEEWQKKRDDAQAKLNSAKEQAFIADEDYFIAECNAVADDSLTRAELGDLIRKAIRFRGEYRPNRRNETVSYEERILRFLEAAQMERSGLLEIKLSNIEGVYVNVRGSSQERYLTGRQMHRVWEVIEAHCPKRSDGGYATPYALQRVGKYGIAPLSE